MKTLELETEVIKKAIDDLKEQLECKLDVSKRIESIEERIKRQEEILDLLIKIFKI